jgi:hypothetical protein
VLVMIKNLLPVVKPDLGLITPLELITRCQGTVSLL